MNHSATGGLPAKMPAAGADPQASAWPALIRSVLVLGGKMSLALAAPMALSFFISGLAGRLGALEFSAYALVSSLSLTLTIAANGVLQALYFVAGRELGRHDPAAYRRAIIAGAAAALAMALPIMAVTSQAGPLCRLLGLPEGLASLTAPLGYAFALGVLPTLLMMTLRVHAALRERAGLTTAWSLLGTSLAAALAMSFAAGDRPSGELLVALALAPVAANWVVLLVAGAALKQVPALRLPAASADTATPPWRLLATVGWPIGAVIFLDNATFLMANLLVGRYWPDWLVVHGCAALWIVFCQVVPLGLASAAVQRVTVLHAKGDVTGRNRVAVLTLATGALYSLAVTAAFLTAPVALGSLLLGARAEQLAAGLGSVLPLAGLLLGCQSLIIIAAAVLRGLGQTRSALARALVGYGLVAGGGQLLLGLVFDLQVTGIWLGLLAGFAVTAASVLLDCRRALLVDPEAAVARPAAS